MAVIREYIKVIVTLEIVLTFSYGFILANNHGEENDEVIEITQTRVKRNNYFQYRSVHHYARHGLCRNFKGKQYFYKAMKTKLCGMKLSFIADFVLDLCRNKNKMLDKWVAELFDIERDGYISHFEKRLYVEDD